MYQKYVAHQILRGGHKFLAMRKEMLRMKITGEYGNMHIAGKFLKVKYSIKSS